MPQPPPPPAPYYPGMQMALQRQWCDTCAPEWNLLDGVCDDGGPDASWSECEFNTDCTDCGNRLTTTPHLGHMRMTIDAGEKTWWITPRQAAEALLQGLDWYKRTVLEPRAGTLNVLQTMQTSGDDMEAMQNAMDQAAAEKEAGTIPELGPEFEGELQHSHVMVTLSRSHHGHCTWSSCSRLAAMATPADWTLDSIGCMTDTDGLVDQRLVQEQLSLADKFCGAGSSSPLYNSSVISRHETYHGCDSDLDTCTAWCQAMCVGDGACGGYTVVDRGCTNYEQLTGCGVGAPPICLTWSSAGPCVEDSVNSIWAGASSRTFHVKDECHTTLHLEVLAAPPSSRRPRALHTPSPRLATTFVLWCRALSRSPRTGLSFSTSPWRQHCGSSRTACTPSTPRRM